MVHDRDTSTDLDRRRFLGAMTAGVLGLAGFAGTGGASSQGPEIESVAGVDGETAGQDGD